MARQNKVFLIHDLPDKRFIQGKVMVPDSATDIDIDDFLQELSSRLFDLVDGVEEEEENV